MGLRKIHSGPRAAQNGPDKRKSSELLVALAGNPNVGKSTLFNALTGMHQHTGNWSGKTVECAQGRCTRRGRTYMLIDLPGIYSLAARSAEEETARDFLQSGGADAVVVVCDATCMERGLILTLQTLELTEHAVLCVNLLDEAYKKGITIDLARLENELGVPVVGTSAGRGEGLSDLLDAAARAAEHASPRARPERPQWEDEDRTAARMAARAEELCRRAVTYGAAQTGVREEKLDRLLTGRATAIPLMLLLLMGVLWLTVEGANYPSAVLQRLLFSVQDRLWAAFSAWGAPDALRDALVLGVWRVTAWVVSVMLPPMAIFFPLFTLLEDFGLLPRIAFVMDHAFQRARSCGKQALTMCLAARADVLFRSEKLCYNGEKTEGGALWTLNAGRGGALRRVRAGGCIWAIYLLRCWSGWTPEVWAAS